MSYEADDTRKKRVHVVGMEEDFFPQKFWKKYLHHLNNLVKPFPKQFQFQDLHQNWKRYRSLVFISFHVLGGEIVTTF